MTDTPRELHAVRFHNGDQDWRIYPLGEELTDTPGGTARVYAFAANAQNVTLLAKLYHDAALTQMRASGDPRPRVVQLALQAATLAEQLPFCAWPRRIIFDRPDVPPADYFNRLLGFSMEKYAGAYSLYDIIHNKEVRARMHPDDTVYVASVLAGQLEKLHRHALAFIYVDMSPNNILVSRDFRQVHFIDTDSFQFTAQGHTYLFQGLTSGHKSPLSDQLTRSRLPLDERHDRFCLAILIFHLFMARAGRPMNPFDAPGQDVDEMIDRQAFVYAPGSPHAVHPSLLAAYQTIEPEIRAAFLTSFTQEPLTARQWGSLLSRHRRFLP